MNKTGQLVITASLNATGMDSFCSTGITSANKTYLWRKKKKEQRKRRGEKLTKRYRFCFACLTFSERFIFI